jgi:DNA-binding transcriptional LysR family regulator
MLHAVIDCNGFSAAAEHLHVSQSTISFTLGKMQEQLGIALLRVEGRKARVTEQGRALMEYSREVIRSAIELEVLAEKMRMGWEPELRLMVDHDCPLDFLMGAMRSFTNSAPHVKVSLSEDSALQVEKAIAHNTVDLAICANVPPGLIADRLLSVRYAMVTCLDHPLAQADAPLSDVELSRYTQIILDIAGTARSASTGRKGSSSAWHVSSMDTVLAALEGGLGYAWLPLKRVERYLLDGRLCLLAMPAHYHSSKDFYLVHARQSLPGVGANTFSGLLHAHAGMHSETDSMLGRVRVSTQ